MIHNSSSDPVLIKKIRLRIWFLRDEVEAVVRARLDKADGEIPDLTDLEEEYKIKDLDNDDLGLLQTPQAVPDTSEDDMAAAMGIDANEDKGEGESDESDQSESEEKVEEDATNNMAPVEMESGKINIVQRSPSIPEDRIIDGTTVLVEVGMDHMFFFCNENFLEGQSIVIEFLVPKKFIINADVKYCRPYNMKSRIISENKTPYRAAASFTFLRPGERTLLRNFLQSVEPEIKVTAGKPKKSAKNNDDDFDELDDLDL